MSFIVGQDFLRGHLQGCVLGSHSVEFGVLGAPVLTAAEQDDLHLLLVVANSHLLNLLGVFLKRLVLGVLKIDAVEQPGIFDQSRLLFGSHGHL